MKNLFSLLVFLALGFANPLMGQFFQATITASGNDLIFSIRPFPGGGNIMTDWSDIEFFVRHPANAPNFAFGTITVNTTQFPGVSIPYNGSNAQGAETGYTNHWFGTSFAVTPSSTYLDGQTYEVFRVALNANPTTLSLELVHNEPNFVPHYLALTSGTGGTDRTSNPTTHNKFYGAGASICSPVNCPASTPGTNHRVLLPGSLPLEMLSFDAQKYEISSSELHWETALEVGVSHFDIERSFEGLHWHKIAQVSAKNEKKNAYKWIDEQVASKNPGLNKAYYRLLATNLDGSTEHSPMRSVDFDAATYFNIYPNPFTEKLSLTSDYTGLINLYFYDLSGRLLLEKQLEAKEWGQTITGDLLQGLPVTPLFLHIADENQMLLHRELLIHL